MFFTHPQIVVKAIFRRFKYLPTTSE